MTTNRHFAKIVAAFALLTLLGQVGHAQQVSKRQKWEYCAITSYSAALTGPLSQPDTKARAVASICYFELTGCRREELKFELELAEFKKSLDPHDATRSLLSAAVDRATEIALARAIVKLGDDGWEMVGESVFKFAAERNDQAIYFKRRK
jgi:hypothetical protein